MNFLLSAFAPSAIQAWNYVGYIRKDYILNLNIFDNPRDLLRSIDEQ